MALEQAAGLALSAGDRKTAIAKYKILADLRISHMACVNVPAKCSGSQRYLKKRADDRQFIG